MSWDETWRVGVNRLEPRPAGLSDTRGCGPCGSRRSEGCPAERALHDGCGGWQEDAHTDRIHNLVTVLQAFPRWAD